MNAIGKPFMGNFLAASRLLIIYLPLAYFLNSYFGLKGIFYARCIANLVVGLLLTALAYRVFIKKPGFNQEGIVEA